MNQDDISFLVQETFLDAAKNAGKYFEFQNTADSKLSKIPRECAGIIYSIKQTPSLFVMRIHACENLENEFQQVLEAPQSYAQLRLNELENIEEQLHFFPCDNFALAKNLKEQFSNKRFPLHEEFLLNVSDPGDSWWLAFDQNSFRINFKLAQTHDMKDLVKLGPLGDSVECSRIFSELVGYFQMLFPVSDFSSTTSEFKISCSEVGNVLFKGISDILRQGEACFEFWEALKEVELKYRDSDFISSIKEANQFIMELSQKRSFWLEVTESLSVQAL